MGQWVGNLITALATISGVLLTQLVTIRIENGKRKREDWSRWLDKKQAAYADYMSAVLDMNRLVGEIESKEKSPTEKECKDHESRVYHSGELVKFLNPNISGRVEELTLASLEDQTLALMARKDIRRAQSVDVEKLIPSIDEIEKQSEEANVAWGFAWEKFIEAARADLGLLEQAIPKHRGRG